MSKHHRNHGQHHSESHHSHSDHSHTNHEGAGNSAHHALHGEFLAHIHGKKTHADAAAAKPAVDHAAHAQHSTTDSTATAKDSGKLHLERTAQTTTGEQLTVPPLVQGNRAEAKMLPSTEPVEKLIGAGVFKPARDTATAHDAQGRPSDRTAVTDAAERNLQTYPVKDIEVQYQDQSGDKSRAKANPDFRVKRDGSVEVLHNPDKSNSDKIVVEVERAAGDRGAPSATQQKAVDGLVGYLSGRYMQEVKNPDGSVTRDGKVEDPQGLVSDGAKRNLHTRPTADDALPKETQDQVHRINRWHGSGGGRHGGDGGRFTPHQAENEFSRRSVPRQPGEDDKLAAIKDVAAGFASHGEKEPYYAVHQRPGRGHVVGRYGIGHDQFMSWLNGLSDAEIQKLIAEGKLPKGALDVKNGKQSPEGDKFQAFLDKMKSGQGNISKDEIKHFMPKELQERIGSDLVKQYASETADRGPDGKPTRVNIGKIAISMEQGHAATDADAAKPENKALMDAAEKAYPLALQHRMDGSANIDLSDAQKKITSAAHGSLGQALWTRNMSDGNLGCAASVSSVLRDAGVANVNEVGVSALASNLRNHGWQPASFEQRQPGDVIIALGPRHGHTGIVGETKDITYDNHSSSGRWSQDRAGYWQSGRWPTVYVLKAPTLG